jgi:hypothetical protein
MDPRGRRGRGMLHVYHVERHGARVTLYATAWRAVVRDLWWSDIVARCIPRD